jgi:DNA-directed RNA polymerase subunit RPC12/RpoP
MTSTPRFLDGSALAGELADCLGAEATAASGQCLSCSQELTLAQAHAYLGGPGMVLRCPGCQSVLLRLVRSPTHRWLDVRGLAYLQVETPT